MIRFKKLVTTIVAAGIYTQVLADTPSNASDAAEVPLEELRKFAHIYEQIRLNYVDELDDETMLKNAIKGMLQNLDPHSTYLSGDEHQDLQERTKGEYSGIGVEVSSAPNGVLIISPIDETPAAKAGILAGDVIVEFNGTPVLRHGIRKTIDDLRGEEGTSVDLGIRRQGVDEIIRLTITRATVALSSVRSRMIEDNIGYIRVSHFQLQSGIDVGTHLNELRDSGAKSIILDLRNNPGGVIKAAVDMVDQFTDSKLVVYTKGQSHKAQTTFSGETPDQSDNIPLVVLINEGSASASEIVAGALQDHHRAIIIGTRSFGKGSVQSVVQISDDAAIKLTTALFYTPSGRSIQAQGISPDIFVERAKIEQLQPRNLRISEAQLTGHLANGNGEDDVSPEDRTTDQRLNDAADRLKTDNQLFSAVNIAKTLIYSPK